MFQGYLLKLPSFVFRLRTVANCFATFFLKTFIPVAQGDEHIAVNVLLWSVGSGWNINVLRKKVAKQFATVRKRKTKEGSFKRYPWNISDSVDYRNKPDLAILWRGWSVAKFWKVFFSNLLAAVLPILYTSGIYWKTFPCQKWTWMDRNGPIRS